MSDTCQFAIAYFSLQCGAVLSEATIVYQTYGELNSDRSNVILYPTYNKILSFSNNYPIYN